MRASLEPQKQKKVSPCTGAMPLRQSNVPCAEKARRRMVTAISLQGSSTPYSHLSQEQSPHSTPEALCNPLHSVDDSVCNEGNLVCSVLVRITQGIPNHASSILATSLRVQAAYSSALIPHAHVHNPGSVMVPSAAPPTSLTVSTKSSTNLADTAVSREVWLPVR